MVHTWDGQDFRSEMCSSAPLRAKGRASGHPGPPGGSDSHQPSFRLKGLVVRNCGLQRVAFLMLKSGEVGAISEGWPGAAPSSPWPKRGLSSCSWGVCVCVHVGTYVPVCVQHRQTWAALVSDKTWASCKVLLGPQQG